MLVYVHILLEFHCLMLDIMELLLIYYLPCPTTFSTQLIMKYYKPFHYLSCDLFVSEHLRLCDSHVEGDVVGLTVVILMTWSYLDQILKGEGIFTLHFTNFTSIKVSPQEYQVSSSQLKN